MSIGLMESARTRERDGRGIALSAGVHALVIGLAWYATTGTSVAAMRPNAVIVMPTYRPPAHPTTTSTSTPGHGGSLPRPVADPTIPEKVPPLAPGPVTLSESTVSWDSLVAGPNDLALARGDGPSAGGPAPDGNGVFRTVDVMAEPDPGNPPPVYPDMLRGAGVQGDVSAEFVVDSTGRVMPSTIAFADGDNALFQRSVRRALEAARFRPARVSGRAVRVRMSQIFQFRLER